MIAAWMLYGLTVSLLVAGAAYAVERWAQIRKAPLRWIWAAALPTAVLLPLIVGLLGTAGGERTEAFIGEILTVQSERSATWSSVATPAAGGEIGSLVARLDPLLVILWLSASLGLAGAGLIGSHRLRRRASGWREADVDGRRLVISSDLGPAVMGFLSCRIILPEWVVGASEEVRKLIITHEEEHIRARDPQLLLAAFVFLVALPWNLPLWWVVHRLRLAIEIDCDRRVVARGADLRVYGGLLLDVSGHRSIVFAPALSNPAEFLERRIRAITQRNERSWREPLLALALAPALLLVACELDQPPPPMMGDDPQAAGLEAGDGASVLPPRTVVIEPPASTAAAEPEPTQPTPQEQRTPARPISSGGNGQSDGQQAPPAEPSELSELGREPAFTPMEVRPQLTNRTAFIRELERRYPPALKDAGIGGTVGVWLFINENGQVQNARIQESSGYPQLDATAEELMREVAQFTPAANRGENVPVWIAVPITFETRN